MLLTVELELADLTRARLRMIKTKAGAEVAAPGTIRSEVRTDSDGTGKAAADRDAKATEYFKWASDTEKTFRLDKNRTLPNDDQTKLANAEAHFGINPTTVVNPRPARSWPVL
jgi:hypothetical protein